MLEKTYPFDSGRKSRDTAPPQLQPADDRRLRDVFAKPYVSFVSPDDVEFADKRVPIVPGAPVTTGLGQVVYDHQPMWDRGKVGEVGPVKAFFRCMMAARRKIQF